MYRWVSPRDIVANMLDCDIVVSQFELQSSYYVHFRTNTLEKGMKPLTHYETSNRLNSITAVLLRWMVWPLNNSRM